MIYKHHELSIPMAVYPTASTGYKVWQAEINYAYRCMRADLATLFYADPDYSLDHWHDDGGK